MNEQQQDCGGSSTLGVMQVGYAIGAIRPMSGIGDQRLERSLENRRCRRQTVARLWCHIQKQRFRS